MGFLAHILLVVVAITTDSLVYGGLDTLGDEIAASVQAGLAPLQNLGSRINEQVQRDLKPLKDLEGLGARITQQVEKDLEPVRALEINLKMQQGVGGVTIATYQPEGKQFIIKRHKIYTCNGTIDLTSGNCSGTLKPFQITESSPQSDWCYVRNFASVNNNVCLSTGPLSVQVNNNLLDCRGNSQVLRLTRGEYEELCKSHNQVEFRYIPNLNNHRHVEIPNKNKYVKCENNEANVCVFTSDILPNRYNSQIIVNY